MFEQAAATYQKTKKPHDIFWNRFVARPIASLLIVAPLARTRVTPNQITFISLLVFVAAAAWLALVPGYPHLVLAAVLIQVSYLFDCADGQLARLRGTSSPVGAHLDFLMDEIKAFLLVAAVGVRLWRGTAEPLYLVEALIGLAAVASAISLTGFVRRPEYVAATGTRPAPSAGDYGDGFAGEGLPAAAPGAAPPRSWLARVVGGVERLGRFIIHYPSHILIVALVGRLDLFLHAYVIINAAYAARTFMNMFRKLGRFSR